MCLWAIFVCNEVAFATRLGGLRADLALANDIGHLHHLGLVLEPFMGEDSLGIVRFLVKIPTV